jgi:hypothetical protein
MLSVNPKSRPTISTILEKPFIKKKVASYIYDFMQIYKNDKTLEADEIQCDILKVQAEKLGIFNFLVKEINNFNHANAGIHSGSGNNALKNLQSFNVEELQNNIHIVGGGQLGQLKYNSNEQNELNTSAEKNKLSYLKYLKKKQEEKKKIEEKIAELERQKKNISTKGGRGNSLNNKNPRNGSSVEKLKLKDSFSINMNPSAGRNKRPDSTKKPSRKISQESEHSPVREEFLKNEPIPIQNQNLELFSYKNYEFENQNNYVSNHKLEPLHEVESDEKVIRISQEIERMKEQLEKTQIKISKVEKKLTSREYDEGFKNKDFKFQENEFQNNLEDFVELTDSDEENCEIAFDRGVMNSPSENQDEGVIKLKERIKFFKQ